MCERRPKISQQSTTECELDPLERVPCLAVIFWDFLHCWYWRWTSGVQDISLELDMEGNLPQPRPQRLLVHYRHMISLLAR